MKTHDLYCYYNEKYTINMMAAEVYNRYNILQYILVACNYVDPILAGEFFEAKRKSKANELEL
jgi:hypothetical protein